MSATVPGPDGRPRCAWCAAAPEFFHYHDTEWGFPVDDDRRLFEKLCLEGFQSGLSWRTILAKRENFRAAFLDFDYHRLAAFDEHDVARLLQDPGVVRHRQKKRGQSAVLLSRKHKPDPVACEQNCALTPIVLATKIALCPLFPLPLLETALFPTFCPVPALTRAREK